MRVQIPAYTDRWMQGDRYGEVVKTEPCRGEPPQFHILTVKLDKSGKRVRVNADDCTEV